MCMYVPINYCTYARDGDKRVIYCWIFVNPLFFFMFFEVGHTIFKYVPIYTHMYTA